MYVYVGNCVGSRRFRFVFALFLHVSPRQVKGCSALGWDRSSCCRHPFVFSLWFFAAARCSHLDAFLHHSWKLFKFRCESMKTNGAPANDPTGLGWQRWERYRPSLSLQCQASFVTNPPPKKNNIHIDIYSNFD